MKETGLSEDPVAVSEKACAEIETVRKIYKGSTNNWR
jgi:hypothetical protein